MILGLCCLGPGGVPVLMLATSWVGSQVGPGQVLPSYLGGAGLGMTLGSYHQGPCGVPGLTMASHWGRLDMTLGSCQQVLCRPTQT